MEGVISFGTNLDDLGHCALALAPDWRPQAPCLGVSKKRQNSASTRVFLLTFSSVTVHCCHTLGTLVVINNDEWERL